VKSSLKMSRQPGRSEFGIVEPGGGGARVAVGVGEAVDVGVGVGVAAGFGETADQLTCATARPPAS
jgi:hypothetical protein